jgi:hypothetical protein
MCQKEASVMVNLGELEIGWRLARKISRVVSGEVSLSQGRLNYFINQTC